MTDSSLYARRLQSLRDTLARYGVGAYVQPTQDRFLSEYPPDSSKRLEWMSGFSGSAGVGLFLREPVGGKAAVLFTDGRYTLQAAQQLSDADYHVVNSATYNPVSWLATYAPDVVVGFDPWCHCETQIRSWRGQHIALEPLAENPIDAVWADRPADPAEPIVAHPVEYTAQTSASKRQRLADSLQADAAILTLPDGINWLLNIRGSDIAFNPLVLAYAMLDKAGQVTLVTQPRTSLPDALGDVTMVAIDDLSPDLFAAYQSVQIDPAHAVHGWFNLLAQTDAQVVEAPDPTLLPKAIKNDVEIEGMREAHRRDGRALSAFLRWLEAELVSGAIVSEMQAAHKLDDFRVAESGELYRGPSFDTISGAGPHGAVIHYRVTEQTNRVIGENELYLVDSGGQYPDGTTDVTRTIMNGTPTREMIDRFTRVLKGHIALAAAVFPVGTTGSQLDVLARQHLWQAGVDYDHGTGHGVGSYLCVHEGPQGISKRANSVALEPGMILSNEPGYYKNGEYGIRIENLVVVMPHAREGFLCFETLTLAPIDRRLIDESMLYPQERAWLDEYHARVAANNA